MLATFNSTLDWTAIATFALAVVTAVSLAFGWKALRQAQKEVEEAHRPVVVPVVIARPPDLGPQSVSGSRRTFPARPSVIEAGVLVVPVQNIGSGPALRVEASVVRIDAEGNPWTGPVEPQTPGTVAGIGRDQTIPIEIHAHGWEERWSFYLTLTYEDLAGKKWSTVSRYLADDGRYKDVTITEQMGGA